MAKVSIDNIGKRTPAWAKRLRSFTTAIFTGIIVYSETVAPWFGMEPMQFDKLIALLGFVNLHLWSLFGVEDDKQKQDEPVQN